jgi:hypothetical protein
MKFYLIAAVMVVFFPSCLKESIAGAMLTSKHPGGPTATLSYEINGNIVTLSVDDAYNQNPNSYTLGCSKSGYYSLSALTSFGEFAFAFYTDSLTVGNYKYTGAFGDMFFTRYNGVNEYVHASSDSMSFNVTSYSNGRISGNFSGALTPLLRPSTISNIFGDPGSVLITNGSFENVPVFY